MVRLSCSFGMMLIVAGFLAAGSARAGEMVFKDIAVKCEPAPRVTSGHGYQEMRITVTNLSPDTAHRVTVTSSENATGPQLHARCEGMLFPGSVQSFRFLESVRNIGGGVDVAVDGRRQVDYVQGDFYENRAQMTLRGSNTPRVSIWASPAAYQRCQANGLPLPSTLPFVDARNLQWLEAQEPAEQWSDRWLDYSCFDGIIVTGAEMQAMPPSVRTALEQYVECGGALWVIGAWQAPAHWTSGHQRGGFAAYYAGFGQGFVSGDKDIVKLEKGQQQQVYRAWGATRSPFLMVLDAAKANERFPVIEEEKLTVPVQGLFVVMALFAVIIGPVNILLLTRLGRRIWLLWTVPAVSLVTCLAVFGFMVFTEGWQSRVRAECITVLDEAAGRAASIGWIGYYCPVTPADGLHFGYDTEITPHRSTWQRSGALVDWTQDQHLAQGWIISRVPLHLQVRSCVAAPQRVTVQRSAAGDLRLVNGLPASIRTIYLADTRGNIFSAGDVAAGATGALTAAGKLTQGRPAKMLREAYAGTWTDLMLQGTGSGFHEDNWLDALAKLRADPQAYLRPGCYVAILDAAPFFETGLRDAGMRREASVVYGIMKEPVDAN